MFQKIYTHITSPLDLTGNDISVYFFLGLAIFFSLCTFIPGEKMMKVVLPAILGMLILYWATKLAGIQETLLKALGLIQ